MVTLLVRSALSKKKYRRADESIIFWNTVYPPALVAPAEYLKPRQRPLKPSRIDVT